MKSPNIVSFFETVLRFFFPPLCLHCKENTNKPFLFFCLSCRSQFTPLEPQERCPRCFHTGCCRMCRQKGMPFTHMAAVFDYVGAPASLIKELKYHNKPYLAKEAGSFIALQILRLNWKVPDLIIPVPQSITRGFLRGYNQSLLIAQEVGKLFEKPVLSPLQRRSGDLPQAALNQTQRQKLEETSFSWKNKVDLNEKVVLLVDDVRTTGTTLWHCGQLLREGFPAALYAITLCY